jgi:hypothetical protein
LLAAARASRQPPAFAAPRQIRPVLFARQPFELPRRFFGLFGEARWSPPPEPPDRGARHDAELLLLAPAGSSLRRRRSLFGLA